MRAALVFTLFTAVSAQLSATVSVSIGSNLYNNTFSCRPKQPCWPTLQQWNAFNQSIGGNLFVTTPIGSPCFATSPDYNNATCDFIKSVYQDEYYREQHYGAMEYTNWESCGQDDCIPSNLGPYQNLVCGLGRLSALYVQAQTPAHVATTLAFIKNHNIRLSVRNTGHDYQGRSVSANSLALVTSSFKQMSYVQNFQASNCPAANSQNIGIIGAGVVASDAEAYFNQYGMAVTVGACPSVGIAGGFGQTAGHGPYARAYGLMVDQAVEFDVVTTDGVFRTINQCNNPDLFWAMRGGGGGTYAILIAYKFKLHPLSQIAMYSFRATFPAPLTYLATDSSTVRMLYTALASGEPTWAANNVTGYHFVALSSVETHHILAVGQDPLSTLQSLTADYVKLVRSIPNVTIIEDSYYLYPDQPSFGVGTAGVVARHATVGLGVVTSSRLIPAQQFETPESVDALVDAILIGLNNIAPIRELLKVILIQITPTTPAIGSDPQRQTSTNPEWRNSLWHLIFVGGWVEGETQAGIDATQALARSVAQPTIDLVSNKTANSTGFGYSNEGDYAEPNWQSVFFGSNYNELSQIKAKYDPGNVLNCWKCVGFLGEQDPAYSCYAEDPQPTVSAWF